MATLLKWAQNTTQSKLHSKNSNSNSSSNGTGSERKWIHPPDALQKGHVAYLVKFFGNTVVDQPKGIEVVKEGIRKLRFAQQLRKSETGQAVKTRKVELTISVDGVAIQEPRTHSIMHQFPLHRISYCADDKGEKRFFSFIAKQPNQVDNEGEDKHECFVFISDKLAEEITLTIGQAFELAYKRFLETSGKDLEQQKRAIIVQQRTKRLEQENNIYKQRLLDLTHFVGIKPELDNYLRKQNIRNLLEIPNATLNETNGTNNNNNKNANNNNNNKASESQNGDNKLLDLDLIGHNNLNGNSINNNGNSFAPPIPPRSFENGPTVGTKLEGLLLDEFEQDNDFDPRSFEISNQNGSSPPLIAPPPKPAKRNNLFLHNNFNNETYNKPASTLFENDPFASPTSQNNVSNDPFEMGDFGSPTTTSQDLENAIGILDKRILEMKNGFSRGISFGNDDFSLESLDPLKN